MAALAGSNVLADVSLPAIFGDHMVLQQDATLPVWGWADPGEEVTVAFAGQTKTASAGADGRWRVDLAPLATNEAPGEMTVRGRNAITYRDVVVGDVWLCGGQSNMEWPLGKIEIRDRLAPCTADPLIRTFVVQRHPTVDPADRLEGEWKLSTPGTALDFSVLGTFFGLELRRTHQRPIGLIGSYWGGTAIQSWMSPQAYVFAPTLQKYLDKKKAYVANLPKAMEVYRQQLAEYRKDPSKPLPGQKVAGPPADPSAHRGMLSSLYNGMIHPLIPYAIKGVIWYQGEANSKTASGAYEYADLLSRHIRGWRAAWGQGDFPFLIVQLANFTTPAVEPVEGRLPWTRDGQRRALALPATGMAVAIDLGAKDIHPQRKVELAERLALVARKVAYGEDLVAWGPLYDKLTIEGNKARISFTGVGGGLTIRPVDATAVPKTPLQGLPPGELSGFAIAGKDRKWVWASARIDGDTVVVSSEEVPEPVAVRYAWANDPPVNLGNQEGLPASPFRTDDWKDLPADPPRNPAAEKAPASRTDDENS